MIFLRLLLLVTALAGGYSCASIALEGRALFGVQIEKLPFICTSNTCSKLAASRFSHILGVPNWWFGSVYYLFIALVVISHSPQLYITAIAATVAACIMSLVLIWALQVKLQIVCRVCYLAHAVNFCILFLLFFLFVL